MGEGVIKVGLIQTKSKLDFYSVKMTNTKYKLILEKLGNGP